MARRDIMLAKSMVIVLAGCCIFNASAFIPPLLTNRNTAATCSQGKHARQRASAVISLRTGQQQEPAVAVSAETAPEGSLVLIEVTKKNARVFKSVAKGSVPEIVEPVDEWRVHESNNSEKRSQGQGRIQHHAEKVDPVAEEAYLVKFYMEELSGVIDAADSVLLVGHGNAKSNIAEVFAAALCERKPSFTDKIEDVIRVDGKHITQNQLLKLGRRHLLHKDDPRRPT